MAARRKSTLAGGQVLVVNMIPRSLSRETNQDSEPSITVNPARPLEIVGTAFTGDPMGGPLAPIYLSSDGGNTWRLNSIVPPRSQPEAEWKVGAFPAKGLRHVLNEKSPRCRKAIERPRQMQERPDAKPIGQPVHDNPRDVAEPFGPVLPFLPVLP